MMKTTQDNNVTNHTGVVYTENYIELLGPIRSSVFYTKTRQNNDVTDLTDVVHVEKEIELSWLI